MPDLCNEPGVNAWFQLIPAPRNCRHSWSGVGRTLRMMCLSQSNHIQSMRQQMMRDLNFLDMRGMTQFAFYKRRSIQKPHLNPYSDS